MKLPKIPHAYIAVTLGIGIAAFVLYRLLGKGKEVVDKVGGAIATPIADAWLALTQDDPVSLTMSMVIDGVGTVAMDQILAEGNRTQLDGNTLTFTYRGVKYKVVPPRRSDGNYNAVRA